MTEAAMHTIGSVLKAKLKLGLNLVSVSNRDIILIRNRDDFIAFENRCPHRNKALYQDDSTLEFDQHHLICQHHGAIFELPHGECIAGPCAEEKLTPISLSATDQTLTLYLAPDHRAQGKHDD